MELNNWLVVKTHGSMYQSGLPDIWSHHKTFGERWIELKTNTGSLSTNQIAMFNKMIAHGAKIWLLRTHADYRLLFEPPNYQSYLVYGNDCFLKTI